ncbi:MAG: aminotransferase class I/II-fold pyridoxal phosphate-dependent enzyme, partial [Okeania sp. SIO2H7]|nr:aminotransferase class I/II-fold pyridoxal phosphate-dependent enzyme [Okeania sp. SIO2H7]
ALEAIRQVRQNPRLVQTLQANTRYLRSRFIEHEFDAIGETNVIPLILPEELSPKMFARHLIEEYGLWVSPIWFIAKPRIRIVANALHTKEEMDRLVAAMVATRNALYRPKTMVNC